MKISLSGGQPLLGVAEDRVYLDHGLTGTTCARPGQDQALAAVREGDTLIVTKLDRLARSVPGARGIKVCAVARQQDHATVTDLPRLPAVRDQPSAAIEEHVEAGAPIPRER